MADRNSFRDKAKSIWLRGMKAVGNTAASIASNTRFKVDEMTLQNRRRELLGDVAGTAYSLWLKGEQFPEQVTNMLNELQQLDNELNDLRASKYTGEKKTGETDALSGKTETTSAEFRRSGSSEEAVKPKAESTDAGKEPEGSSPVPAVPPAVSGVKNKNVQTVETSSVQTEIDQIFDETDTVGRMAEKVNSTLEQLSERIHSFPQEEETDRNDD